MTVTAESQDRDANPHKHAQDDPLWWLISFNLIAVANTIWTALALTIAVEQYEPNCGNQCEVSNAVVLWLLSQAILVPAILVLLLVVLFRPLTRRITSAWPGYAALAVYPVIVVGSVILQ